MGILHPLGQSGFHLNHWLGKTLEYFRAVLHGWNMSVMPFSEVFLVANWHVVGPFYAVVFISVIAGWV